MSITIPNSISDEHLSSHQHVHSLKSISHLNTHNSGPGNLGMLKDYLASICSTRRIRDESHINSYIKKMADNTTSSLTQ